MQSSRSRQTPTSIEAAVCVMLLSLCAPLASAQILTNGTGGGGFTVGTTWQGGSAPNAANSWTILSGDAVTASSNISLRDGATGIVQGSFNTTSNVSYSVGGGALEISAGSNSVDRILVSAPGLTNYVGSLVISGGTLDVDGRIYLNQSSTDSTSANSFSMSGGTLDFTDAVQGFRLTNGEGSARAQFSISGNDGAFTGGARALALADSAAPNYGNGATAADVMFTFGTDAGAGALTTVNSGSLTLDGNAITIDFSAIDRGTYNGNFSTTLFDYSSVTGSLGSLTSLGLGAGESASIVQDAANSLYRVDYALAIIPEPEKPRGSS